MSYAGPKKNGAWLGPRLKGRVVRRAARLLCPFAYALEVRTDLALCQARITLEQMIIGELEHVYRIEFRIDETDNVSQRHKPDFLVILNKRAYALAGICLEAFRASAMEGML